MRLDSSRPTVQPRQYYAQNDENQKHANHRSNNTTTSPRQVKSDMSVMSSSDKSNAAIAEKHGIVPSHGISIDVDDGKRSRPQTIRHV